MTTTSNQIKTQTRGNTKVLDDLAFVFDSASSSSFSGFSMIVFNLTSKSTVFSNTNFHTVNSTAASAATKLGGKYFVFKSFSSGIGNFFTMILEYDRNANTMTEKKIIPGIIIAKCMETEWLPDV